MKKIFNFRKKKKRESPLSYSAASPCPAGAYERRPKELSKLHRAAAAGVLVQVRQALKKYSIDGRNKEQRTALHLACANGHADVVTFLVENNCELNLPDTDNRSPLMKAVQCQQEKCATVLLEHGADPNLADASGNTALHMAAVAPNTSLARMLIEHSAHIDAKNKEGCTPLILAVSEHHEEMVELLLKKGADVHARDKGERTPLMSAAAGGELKLIKLLLCYGADLSHKDTNGWTAEDYAIIHGHSSLSKQLADGENTGEASARDSQDIAVPMTPDKSSATGFTLGAPAMDRAIDDISGGGSIRSSEKEDDNDRRHTSDEEELDFTPKVKCILETTNLVERTAHEKQTDRAEISPQEALAKNKESHSADKLKSWEERYERMWVENEKRELKANFKKVTAELKQLFGEIDESEKTTSLAAEVAEDDFKDELENFCVSSWVTESSNKLESKGEFGDTKLNADLEEPKLEIVISNCAVLPDHSNLNANMDNIWSADEEDCAKCTDNTEVPLAKGEEMEENENGISRNVEVEKEERKQKHFKMQTMEKQDLDKFSTPAGDITSQPVKEKLALRKNEEKTESEKMIEEEMHTENSSSEERLKLIEMPLKRKKKKKKKRQSSKKKAKQKIQGLMDDSTVSETSQDEERRATRTGSKKKKVSTQMAVTDDLDLTQSSDTTTWDAEWTTSNCKKAMLLLEQLSAVYAGSAVPLKIQNILLEYEQMIGREKNHHTAVQSKAWKLENEKEELQLIAEETKDLKSMLAHQEVEFKSDIQSLKTALHLACANGHADVVTFLVENNCELNLPDTDNRSPLIDAVQCQQEKCATVLLEHGADPNLADASGNTALHMAAVAPNTSLARMLIEHSAHIDAKNKEGCTPLILAVSEHHEEMVAILLKKGADVHARDEGERTPLMTAAAGGELKLIKLLLCYGADLSHKDTNGWTAEDYAIIHGHSSLSKQLADGENTGEASARDSQDIAVPMTPDKSSATGFTLGAPAMDRAIDDISGGGSIRSSEKEDDNDRRHTSDEEELDFTPKSDSESLRKVSPGVLLPAADEHGACLLNISGEHNNDECSNSVFHAPSSSEEEIVMEAIESCGEQVKCILETTNLVERTAHEKQTDRAEISPQEALAKNKESHSADKQLNLKSWEERYERMWVENEKRELKANFKKVTAELKQLFGEIDESEKTTSLAAEVAEDDFKEELENFCVSSWVTESSNKLESKGEFGDTKLNADLEEPKLEIVISNCAVLPDHSNLNANMDNIWSADEEDCAKCTDNTEVPLEKGEEMEENENGISRNVEVEKEERKQKHFKMQTMEKQDLDKFSTPAGDITSQPVKEKLALRKNEEKTESEKMIEEEMHTENSSSEERLKLIEMPLKRKKKKKKKRQSSKKKAKQKIQGLMDDSTVSETSQDEERRATRTGSKKKKVSTQMAVTDDLDLTQSSDTTTWDAEWTTSNCKKAMLLLEQLSAVYAGSAVPLKIQNILLEYEQMIGREKNHHTAVQSKAWKLENEKEELQLIAEETKDLKSMLAHQEVEFKSDIQSLKFSLKQEEERRLKAEMQNETMKEQLRKKEDQYYRETEKKQQLELHARNLETELISLRKLLKQTEEERDEIQMQLTQEKSARALQEGILNSHLQRQKDLEVQSRKTMEKNSEESDTSEREKDLLYKNQLLQEEIAMLRLEFDQVKLRHQEDEGKYVVDNETMKEKNEDLKKELKLNEEALTQTVLQYSGQLNFLRMESAVLTSKLEQTKEIKDRLAIEIESFRSCLNTAVQDLERHQSLKSDVERTFQREREEWLRLQDKLHHELCDMREATKGLTQQLSKMESKASSLENELHRLKQTLQEETLLLELTQKELNQAQWQAKESHHAWQLEKDQVSKFMIKQESMQERLAQFQSENILLHQQLEDLQNKGIMKEKAVNDVQDRCNDTFNKLRADTEKQVYLVEERNKELNTECTDLREQVFKHETDKVERECTVRQLQQELAEALKKQSMSEASLEVTTRCRSDLEEDNLRLQKELDRVKTKLQESEEQRIQSEHCVHDLKAVLDYQEREISASSQKLQDLLLANSGTNITIKQLEEHVQRLEIENARLEATSKQQTNRIEALQKDLQASASVTELSQKLELESKKCIHLEAQNQDLKEALHTLHESHEKLEKNKRQLKEEVAKLRHHLETNTVNLIQIEQYKKEIDERAAQEVRQKLQEVNVFLQAQAASQDRLEQIRASHRASLTNQLKHRIESLEYELDRIKNTQQDNVFQQESTKAEAERYKERYLEEMKARICLGNKLERANEKLSEANTKLLQACQRSKSLIASSFVGGGLPTSPVLYSAELGHLDNHVALNRSLGLGGSFLGTAGNVLSPQRKVEAYMAKIWKELDEKITKELERATADLGTRSPQGSPMVSINGSSKNLSVDQDPHCRAIQEYRDVLTKNYLI